MKWSELVPFLRALSEPSLAMVSLPDSQGSRGAPLARVYVKHKHILLLLLSFSVVSGQGELRPWFQRLLVRQSGSPVKWAKAVESPVMTVQRNTNISIDRQSKEAATSALPRSPSGDAIHGFTLRRNSPAAFLAFIIH